MRLEDDLEAAIHALVDKLCESKSVRRAWLARWVIQTATDWEIDKIMESIPTKGG